MLQELLDPSPSTMKLKIIIWRGGKGLAGQTKLHAYYVEAITMMNATDVDSIGPSTDLVYAPCIVFKLYVTHGLTINMLICFVCLFHHLAMGTGSSGSHRNISRILGKFI